MSAPPGQRSYRLEPLDTSGVFFGMGVIQCVLLGTAMTGAVIALSAGLPLIVAAVPLVVAGGLSFARLGDHAVWEWLPLGLSWVAGHLRGRRWQAPLPLWPTDTGELALPPCLDGLGIIEVPWQEGRSIGAVHDRQRHTYTALVPVRPTRFAVEPRPDQERLLAGWGDVLNQFSKGRAPVAHVFWSDLARPSSLAGHVASLAGVPRGSLNDMAAASYHDLLGLTAASATAHEVVVGITVARDLLNHRSRGKAAARERLADTLITAVEALIRGLGSAGQSCGDPLDADGLRAMLRVRVDPIAVRRRRRTGRLADRLGIVAAAAAGPLVLESGWSHVRADAAWHRTYWVAAWPQLALPPSWMEPFLAVEGVTRSMTVALVPVTGHESRRRISRDLVKLESDATTKEDRGRRVDARHHRLTEALLEREQELVTGYAEFGYVGLVTVSATSEDELDEHSEMVEQLARESGIDLRVLDGRQDIAWAAALPLGLAPKTLVAP
jgi:hypothetical protein